MKQPVQTIGSTPQPTVDDVRNKLLRAMHKHAGLPNDAHASMVRNWAVAYGILTDKALAEKPLTSASGDSNARDQADLVQAELEHSPSPA